MLILYNESSVLFEFMEGEREKERQRGKENRTSKIDNVQINVKQ